MIFMEAVANFFYDGSGKCSGWWMVGKSRK